MSTFSFNQIGVIRSPYKEKFAVPRQPGLIEDGGGELQLLAPYNQPEAVRGLSGFSHLWVIFIFHQTMEGGWRPTVRPPRLGGNTRMGVFATRSTFRPNPIGMSLIELKAVRCQGGEVILELGSLDLVDGTPVIDIKPYLPFAESQPLARAGFAQTAPDTDMQVCFSITAEQQLTQQQQRYPYLRRFITQVLAQDPRPAYRKEDNESREYAVLLLEFNVRWRVIGRQTEVLSIDHC
ncbi:tRNA (N6-threonylcarbamoyladenosine(37)-N6)-methyltransferase TrmO [Yersinia vastinensis]|uniref:tRNA (N6-threonylcarbamoyladenosine(37)-N6)-methyltransferase TrmO n=1 Tax=Yersinia vastinensis TaxID=2890318 RepID=UPI0005E52BF8|nr:tRNA (N6-threonylcarbamoyladenosine(37)-N6)-methyltransferase TrmO [Yersinia vastinensis]OVZ98491.1 tRNA (N6-threonylcarbamoyladenosine(37)-N6)-methyltransferase TrmO [Yersinia frederiksenii]CNI59973.1 putative methyltransferase%2C YaeB/AF_0241 family [Yersinia frederiksenii]CNK89687.1 putative methyltransferase%2C YaeB/AF_0241 family [Yersinia frederiksenii]